MVYVLAGQSTLQEVDRADGSWGQSVDLQRVLQDGIQSIFEGNDEIFYVCTLVDLYSYDARNNSLTHLFNYQLLGIFGSPEWLIQTDEYSFIIGSTCGNTFRIYPEDSQTSDPSDIDTRNVLTLALTLPTYPDVMEAIEEFNNTNEEYRIEIRRVTSDNIPRLQTEMMTGQMPDIIFYDGTYDYNFRRTLPAQRLAARGLLANLYDFLDLDTELGRGSFMPNLLEAASTGDSLYELPFRFSLYVTAGDANRLGTELGWTFDDLLRILEDTNFDGSLFCPNTDRLTVLWTFLTFLIDDFINWDTGNVYFETPEFQKLLEVIKTYTKPEIYGDKYSGRDYIALGRLLMIEKPVFHPNEMQYFDAFFEEMVPIGLPVSSGVGNAISFRASFSISAVTEHPEAVWSFVRQFYFPQFCDEYCDDPCAKHNNRIPFHIDALEAWLYSRDSGYTLRYDNGSIMAFVDEATEYDIERTRRILESVTRVIREDRDVIMIIREEADTYFRDLRSVEDTSRVIQNRVQTFVWEQMR